RVEVHDRAGAVLGELGECHLRAVVRRQREVGCGLTCAELSHGPILASGHAPRRCARGRDTTTRPTTTVAARTIPVHTGEYARSGRRRGATAPPANWADCTSDVAPEELLGVDAIAKLEER